ncbi:mechanosensitive ion channel [Deferribacterales bacterium RsTz2092]
MGANVADNASYVNAWGVKLTADNVSAGVVTDNVSTAAQATTDKMSISSIIDAFSIDAVMAIVQRLLLLALVIAIQIFAIKQINKLFGKLFRLLPAFGAARFKPIRVKHYQLLNTHQITNIALIALRGVHYLAIAIFLFLTIPLIFGIFPITRSLAVTLWGYVFNPIETIFFSFIFYIPNLFTIAVIVFIARYVLRGMEFISEEIAKGRLVLGGFYPDWAKPTYTLLKYILYAFLAAIIYPYLPGSESAAFKGVSIFAGLLFSLGSSSAIGNIVAGLVITYMRPFKVGDRIKVGDVIGFVVEKSTMVTRIVTHKNEHITMPNTMLVSSSSINYNKAIEADGSMIIYVNMTMGYAVPWRQIHKLLVEAAKRAKYIEKTPEPWVQQLGLEDFYATYQLNAATKCVDILPAVYSELFQNMQDVFIEAGIDLTAQHFFHITQTGEVAIKDGGSVNVKSVIDTVKDVVGSKK